MAGTLSTQSALDIALYAVLGTVPSWAANTSFWLALYLSDPGVGGPATNNEISYTGYGRVAITRSSGFTSTNPSTNTGLITFGQMTAGTGGNATYGALVTTSSGAGTIIARGALSPALSVVNGVIPQIAIGGISFQFS